MSIADLLNMDGILTHATDEGAVTDDFVPTASTEDTAVKCWIEQAQRSERTVGGPIEADTWNIYLPAGTVCGGADTLTVGDIVLEFDGPPWPATNPRTGLPSHVQATGKRTQ